MLYNANHSKPSKAQSQQVETLEEAVMELKVITHYLKEGLNVADDQEDVREDVKNEAE